MSKFPERIFIGEGCDSIEICHQREQGDGDTTIHSIGVDIFTVARGGTMIDLPLEQAKKVRDTLSEFIAEVESEGKCI